MNSVLRDAGIGIDGGYPSIVVTLSPAIPKSIFIAVRLGLLDGQNGPSRVSKLDQQPDESAIHSMKEKQQ